VGQLIINDFHLRTCQQQRQVQRYYLRIVSICSSRQANSLTGQGFLKVPE
jgi:hypothetical protein